MYKRPFILLLVIFLNGVIAAGGEEAEVSPPRIPALDSARSQSVIELWSQGKKWRAQKELKKWIREENQSPDPWVAAARLKYMEGDFKKCLSLCKIALKKNHQYRFTLITGAGVRLKRWKNSSKRRMSFGRLWPQIPILWKLKSPLIESR